jgi:opacity protein-like surface antigen
MSALKGFILAAVVAVGSLAAASAVQARDIAINQEGQMVVFSGTGQAKIGTMKSFDTFKNGAKPLAGGVVIFMHEGKLYMYDDPKSAMHDHATDIGQF